MAVFEVFNGNIVNLSTAQAGNAASTNVVQRRFDVIPRGMMMRIVAAAGSACSYLIEGSPDNAVWWPLPNGDVVGATPGPFVLSIGVFTLAAPATLWRLIPVDIPWTFLRVTYSANTAMTNTTDVWPY